MRTIKKNILKSFLFVCLGLIITTITFASVRHSYDIASPPGRPEAIDIWGDRCSLRYRAPVSNGGAAVTDYIVQGRDEEDNRWRPQGSSKTLQHTIRGGGFVEGSSGVFRVFAQNAAGLSRPSLESNPITFADPY